MLGVVTEFIVLLFVAGLEGRADAVVVGTGWVEMEGVTVEVEVRTAPVGVVTNKFRSSGGWEALTSGRRTKVPKGRP